MPFDRPKLSANTLAVIQSLSFLCQFATTGHGYSSPSVDISTVLALYAQAINAAGN